MEKLKKIIGYSCKYSLWGIIGILFFCLVVGFIDAVGIKIVIISIAGLSLFVFIVWAAIAWGKWGE